MADRHWLDSTTIFAQLARRKRDVYVALVVYALLFFYSLFAIILELLATSSFGGSSRKNKNKSSRGKRGKYGWRGAGAGLW